MTLSDFLQWEQWVRDNGLINNILVQGLTASVNIHCTKRVSAEALFPHLAARPSRESLADRIRRRLGLAPLPD